MNRELVMEIVKLMVMVISAIATTYIIPWIKANTENAKMKTLIKWAEKGVYAAEQIYGAKTGEEKKKYVAKLIEIAAAKYNINILPQEINMLIEAAVGQMNMEDYITVKPEDYAAITGEE